MATAQPGFERRVVPWYRRPRVLGGIAQAVFAVAVVYVAAAMLRNMWLGLEARNLPIGFGFLAQPADFTIAEHLIPYTESDSYARAFAAGVANTLLVAALGIAWATAVGVLFGVARLSGNPLLRAVAAAYVETLRNVPLLVQLFVWYVVVFLGLPGLRQSLALPGGIQLNNRGVFLPWPGWSGQGQEWALATALALALGALAAWRLAARRRREGRRPPGRWALGGGALGIAAFVTAAFQAGGVGPFTWEVPVLQGFNFAGGLRVSPEFAALLTGLSLYTAAFIAEVVRGGILAVPRGQSEAAGALGLSRAQALRFVVLPQALRVIIPPLVNQYLNLTKNSSLAVAIAFPDLVAIGNTIINQSGMAVQMMVLVMGSYLAMSLAISSLLNAYNRRTRWGGH